ncbi:unnamed protein product [Urochloa decumbens]|uniref:HMA domain-containing protein n=1 Tax=Urochloa decumbens TaxID=240449 RepID=A0ABC9ECE0_9POAL
MPRFWRTHKSTATLSDALSMNVHMDCDGCEKRVRKAMSRLQGVSSVEIDMERQKVTFWPWPYEGEYYPFAIQYLVDDTYLPTDRYYRHGYNDPMIGSYPCHAFTHILDDAALAVFHDDNVHACAIM